MLTLFHVLVINNWNNTTDMYCTVMDSGWPKLYFGLFWVVSVMIMLNIVISFVLEMYSIVSEEVESTYRKRTLANQLVDVFETEE